MDLYDSTYMQFLEKLNLWRPSQMMYVRDSVGGERRKFMFNGYRVSAGKDEKVLRYMAMAV